jgi:hypothetical protein
MGDGVPRVVVVVVVVRTLARLIPWTSRVRRPPLALYSDSTRLTRVYVGTKWMETVIVIITGSDDTYTFADWIILKGGEEGGGAYVESDVPIVVVAIFPPLKLCSRGNEFG